MEQLNHTNKMGQYDDMPDMLEYDFFNVILYLIGSQCKSNNVAEICEKSR